MLKHISEHTARVSVSSEQNNCKCAAFCQNNLT